MSAEPGDIGFAGIITRDKYGNPGLAGSTGVEVTLVEFTDRGDEGAATTGESRLVQGWCLTLGSLRGQLGGDGKYYRAVQLHFELILPNGLFLYLVRGLLPEDFDKYPKDGYGPGAPQHLSDAVRRDLHEQLVDRGEVFISQPCLQLIGKAHRAEQEMQAFLCRRRWGLYLTDDANTWRAVSTLAITLYSAAAVTSPPAPTAPPRQTRWPTSPKKSAAISAARPTLVSGPSVSTVISCG